LLHVPVNGAYTGGGSAINSSTSRRTDTYKANKEGGGSTTRTLPAITPVTTPAFTPVRPLPQQWQQHGSAEALHQQRVALQQSFELRSQLNTAINSSAARQCVKDNLRVRVRAVATSAAASTQVATVVDSGVSAQQLQLEHALRSELSTFIGNSAVSHTIKHGLLSQLLSYTTDHMLQQQQEQQQQQQQLLVPPLHFDHTAVQRIHTVQTELLTFIATTTGHDGVRVETQEKWQQCILAANAPELSLPHAAVTAENLLDAAIDVEVYKQGQLIQLIENSGVAADIVDLWVCTPAAVWCSIMCTHSSGKKDSIVY
jgi:hypothetical protein